MPSRPSENVRDFTPFGLDERLMVDLPFFAASTQRLQKEERLVAKKGSLTIDDVAREKDWTQQDHKEADLADEQSYLDGSYGGVPPTETAVNAEDMPELCANTSF